MKGRTKVCFALAAGAMAVTTGGAVAASSGGSGVIRACASRTDGALRLLVGRNCPRGYRAISWNQHGLAGTPGTNGVNGVNGTNGTGGTNAAATVTVRTVNRALNETCTPIAPPTFFNCATTSTLTASCNPGEKATGGGFTAPASTASNPISVGESRPNVDAGTPTGWQVTATAGSTFSPTSTVPAVPIPVYVVCVAP
jgi:hypothetical protein